MKNDKYPYHVQMYCRLCLKSRTEKSSRLSVNYGFDGGDDDAVVEMAKQHKVPVKTVIKWADEYLENGCGMAG